MVRDPAQSEEVAQEVLLGLWRSAARFDPRRGSALSWILTVAHRRAVDRVRSARAAGEREQREARRAHHPAFDQVSEEVEAGLEREWVRRCPGPPDRTAAPVGHPRPTTTDTPTGRWPSASPFRWAR